MVLNMNLDNAVDNYQANVETVDAQVNSPENIPCTHPISTVCSDDDIYAIICDSCGKQFTEEEWCDFKEKEQKV